MPGGDSLAEAFLKMTAVPEFDRLSEEVVVWQGYNPEVRCDCGSCAVLRPGGWVLFDPIPLADVAWGELLAQAPVQRIVLTSGNHQRESLILREMHGVAVHAPVSARGEIEADHWHTDGETVDGFRLIPLPGGGPGESAWCDDDTLVIGDAMIHLDGLAILPAKYCADERSLQKSLAILPSLAFSRVTFAHGLPLVTDARSRLTEFLKSLPS